MSFSESLFHRDLIILFWIPSLICLFSALILFIKGKNILYFSMVLPIIGFLLMVYYTAVVLSALTDSLLLLLLYCSLLIRGIYVTIKDIKKEQYIQTSTPNIFLITKPIPKDTAAMLKLKIVISKN